MMMNEKQLNHSVNSLFEFASHLHGLTTQLIENEKKNIISILRHLKKEASLWTASNLHPIAQCCAHMYHTSDKIKM